MTIQKFAWKPTLVWNMKTKHYYFSYIWLCWYWDCGYDSDIMFFRLKDEAPITHKRYTRRRSNRW